ncbi:MAG: CidA/LrgA family protein [Tannerellaceae bacterium]|nr:CidA/LrgA family protein [Tannerellaceae bacterium]
MLKEIFYILLFYFTGECISSTINGIIPGSVIGMVLLFLALLLKVIKPGKVKRVSKILTRNMAFFFLPAGVGLMDAFGTIAESWVTIITVSIISTFLVIATVSFLQEKQERS